MARKNSSPTRRPTTGKRWASASIRPVITLLRYTANLRSALRRATPRIVAGTARSGSSRAWAKVFWVPANSSMTCLPPGFVLCADPASATPLFGHQDRLRAFGLGSERRECRNIVIPFDHCRDRAGARNRSLEQRPDHFGYLAAVRVD